MLLEKVCNAYGVRLISYQDARPLIQDLCMEDAVARTSGIAGFVDGVPFILFDNARSELDALFIIAHELGHILLGHLTFNSWFCWEMDDVAEREADAFAVQLLARTLANRYSVWT